MSAQCGGSQGRSAFEEQRTCSGYIGVPRGSARCRPLARISMRQSMDCGEHELTRSNQSGNAIDGTRAAEAAPCADIMHSGYHERQAQQGARERVHRDQHSTIQMDRLNHKYRPRSDTHHFDPTLSSSGCRPRGRCASAPPGQSCAVRQRIRLWQRRGAARRSRPSSAKVGLFSDAKVS